MWRCAPRRLPSKPPRVSRAVDREGRGEAASPNTCLAYTAFRMLGARQWCRARLLADDKDHLPENQHRRSQGRQVPLRTRKRSKSRGSLRKKQAARAAGGTPAPPQSPSAAVVLRRRRQCGTEAAATVTAGIAPEVGAKTRVPRWQLQLLPWNSRSKRRRPPNLQRRSRKL